MRPVGSIPIASFLIPKKMNFPYESTGTIKVSNKDVRVICDRGIIEYYKYFVEKRWFGANVQFGKYGSHISIVYAKENNGLDLKKVKKFHNKLVKFTYDPYIIMGGFNKPFKNFWIKVDLPEYKIIRSTLGLPLKTGYGPHITICNTKNL